MGKSYKWTVLPIAIVKYQRDACSPSSSQRASVGLAPDVDIVADVAHGAACSPCNASGEQRGDQWGGNSRNGQPTMGNVENGIVS